MPLSASEIDAFVAIAEPQRRKIIELLAPRGRSVNDIARALGLGQPQTSKHLKVLKDAGLVEVRVAGQQRIYTLVGQPLARIQAWAAAVTATWHDRFDQLDALLVELDQEEPTP